MISLSFKPSNTNQAFTTIFFLSESVSKFKKNELFIGERNKDAKYPTSAHHRKIIALRHSTAQAADCCGNIENQNKFPLFTVTGPGDENEPLCAATEWCDLYLSSISKVALALMIGENSDRIAHEVHAAKFRCELCSNLSAWVWCLITCGDFCWQIDIIFTQHKQGEYWARGLISERLKVFVLFVLFNANFWYTKAWCGIFGFCVCNKRTVNFYEAVSEHLQELKL